MFLSRQIIKSTGSYLEQINKLKSELVSAEAVVIGTGAGLSTSAGFTYSGERFLKYFSDFAVTSLWLRFFLNDNFLRVFQLRHI